MEILLYSQKFSSTWQCFASITILFCFLAATAIVLATLSTIKCGTPLLAASSVPRIAVFAAVVKMAFVVYQASSDPIMPISRSYISVLSHCETSTLVYNHTDSAKRAVISAFDKCRLFQSKQRVQYMNQFIPDCGVTCKELCGY